LGVSEGRSRGVARAAAVHAQSVDTAQRSVVIHIASRLLALQLALRTSAVGGLEALLTAVELLADWRALRLGSHASGVAAGRLADGLALVAGQLLAGVLGASNGADGALAVNGALGARYLLALHLALRASAHWVANSRALRVVAHPLAHRVARASSRQGHNAIGGIWHLFLFG